MSTTAIDLEPISMVQPGIADVGTTTTTYYGWRWYDDDECADGIYWTTSRRKPKNEPGHLFEGSRGVVYDPTPIRVKLTHPRFFYGPDAGDDVRRILDKAAADVPNNLHLS